MIDTLLNKSNEELRDWLRTEMVDVQIKHLCPHCGESYYMENYNTTTCVYYPPIYKDGVNINPDRNKTTTHCTCMNCGKEFSFTR